MPETALSWETYLSNLASFAGTLFALVLAARQIRGRLVDDPEPRVARANFLDSVAVTVELAAAASFGVLFAISGSVLFPVAVTIVSLAGLTLSTLAMRAYFRALRAGNYSRVKSDRLEARLQAWGSLVPIACYGAAAIYAWSRLADGAGSEWVYAGAASWLTFSGSCQAVWWYARIWEREKPRIT